MVLEIDFCVLIVQSELGGSYAPLTDNAAPSHLGTSKSPQLRDTRSLTRFAVTMVTTRRYGLDEYWSAYCIGGTAYHFMP
jgi:hypothetical protein